MRPLVLAVHLILAASGPSETSEEPITESRRREVLNQTIPSQTRADLERYLTFILLPLGAVLLCILALRRNT